MRPGPPRLGVTPSSSRLFSATRLVLVRADPSIGANITASAMSSAVTVRLRRL